MALKPFIPPDLPPQLDLSGLLKLVAETREAVARYDEAINHLPEPALIKRSFATKEAVSSSRIEGTQTTFKQALEYDIRATREIRAKLDYEEIFNYRLAIDVASQRLQTAELSLTFIKDLHRVLLNSTRGKDKYPGHFRQTQVYIGPAGATEREAVYVAPPVAQIDRLVDNLMHYMQTDYDDSDILIQAAVLHYQFEAIHPFNDGNGRLGRLLITLYLYKRGLTSLPNLYVSEFLEKHRRDYYEALKLVSANNNWLTWISLCLRAIREQAKLSKVRVDEIDQLYQQLYEQLPKFNSRYAPVFLKALFKLPVCSPKDIAQTAGIDNLQTVYSLIQKFVKADLINSLEESGKQRGQIYIFERLMRILD